MSCQLAPDQPEPAPRIWACTPPHLLLPPAFRGRGKRGAKVDQQIQDLSLQTMDHRCATRRPRRGQGRQGAFRAASLGLALPPVNAWNWRDGFRLRVHFDLALPFLCWLRRLTQFHDPPSQTLHFRFQSESRLSERWIPLCQSSASPERSLTFAALTEPQAGPTTCKNPEGGHNVECGAV